MNKSIIFYGMLLCCMDNYASDDDWKNRGNMSDCPESIDITGLDKAVVLQQLVWYATPISEYRGLILHDPTVEECKEMLEKNNGLLREVWYYKKLGLYFDSNSVDVGLYNAYNGAQKAQKVIAKLRNSNG